LDLLTPLLELLPVYGPSLLFVLAILETSFVTGLAVPSGVATSAATALALEGGLDIVPVVGAAIVGGFVGDSLGFWVGRVWGERIFAGEGRWARLLGSKRNKVNDLFGRHPLYAVTMARLVSFVRTVMPMAAGMSDITYRRYVPYEVAGLLCWAALYVTLGVGARGSWIGATRLLGAGGALAFLVAGVVVWVTLRRRVSLRDRKPAQGRTRVGSGSDAEQAISDAGPGAP
jgi:membrane protein DedA with SNARE-associated domain